MTKKDVLRRILRKRGVRGFSSLLLLTLLSSAFAQFPITVEHKFGETTLGDRPKRVVALGYTEQDTLFALGARPVAVRYFFGDENSAVFPWAEAAANGAEPQVLNMPYGSLNYEAILALQPDLITAVDAGITQEEYDTLSQIAPTLAQPGEYIDFGTPWQERVRLIGRALGESERAEELVADLEARFEEVRAAHPEFADKSVAVTYQNSSGGYGFYTAQDSRAQFFENLGFVVPEELVEVAGESFYADLSEERLNLLDRDLLAFLDVPFAEEGTPPLEENPLLSQLSAVQEGRVLNVTGQEVDALQFGTVLSLDYLLENLVPEIAAAVE